MKADADMIRAAAELIAALSEMRRSGPVMQSRTAFTDGPGVTAPRSYEEVRMNAEIAALRLVAALVLDLERQSAAAVAVKEGGAA